MGFTKDVGILVIIVVLLMIGFGAAGITGGQIEHYIGTALSGLHLPNKLPFGL